MFGFFIFNAIRWVTTEVVAAKVADFVTTKLPRNRVTYRLTDMASYWIYKQTAFLECEDCYTYVIDKKHSSVCKDCQVSRDIERDEDEAFIAEQEAANAAYYAGLEEQERLDEAHDQLMQAELETFDEELDVACSGNCGETVRTCSCAELASLRRHNADPATRGSWWIT
jgi:hypothetical protein